jgi:hypothetical protein
LTDTLANDISVDVVDIAIFCAKLVLLFLVRIVVILVLLNLVGQGMGLSHLSRLILHLLHLDVLKYILLALPKLFLAFSVDVAPSLPRL